MKLLPLLAFALLLSSCSATFYCNRCIKFGGIKSDTTKQIVEVKVPVVRIDTVFKSPYWVINFDSLKNAQPDAFPSDTIILTKDRLVIKYLPGKETFISGECAADTIRVEVPVLVENEIRTGTPTYQVVLITIGVGLILLIAGFLLGKFLTRS